MTRAGALVAGNTSLVLSAVAIAILTGISDVPGLPPVGFYGVATTFTGIGFAIVGLAIAIRRPGHPIGWVALAIAVSQSAGSFTTAYATWGLLVAPEPPPLAAISSWLQIWVWVPGLWLLVSLTYLFPHGRLQTRGQRLLAGLAVLGTLLMAVPAAIAMWPYRGPLLLDASGSSSIPGGDAATTLQFIGVLLNLVVGFGGAAWLVREFRRLTGVERQQRKWFVAAAVVFVALLCVAAFTSVGPPLDAILGMVGGLVLPAAIGIAILRYRLYEIDRIVSRTIGWVVVTALLAAVFAIAIIGLQAVLAPVTASNTLAVAASTLIAAAMFQPLRTRVQRSVDRRFNRARVDAERIVAAFTVQARDDVDLGDLLRAIQATSRSAVGPSRDGVWLRSDR